MAWTTPLTAVANAALTAAQWNASVRDNLLETAVAKATAAGRLYVSTGANALAERIPSFNRTSANESTSSASFGDLATVGPTISTLTTGTNAIVAISSFVTNNTAGQGGYASFAVSGASSIAANTLNALRFVSETAASIQRASYIGMVTGLTGGANTFQAKYSTIGANTAGFNERELMVIPL